MKQAAGMTIEATVVEDIGALQNKVRNEVLHLKKAQKGEDPVRRCYHSTPRALWFFLAPLAGRIYLNIARIVHCNHKIGLPRSLRGKPVVHLPSARRIITRQPSAETSSGSDSGPGTGAGEAAAAVNEIDLHQGV